MKHASSKWLAAILVPAHPLPPLILPHPARVCDSCMNREGYPHSIECPLADAAHPYVDVTAAHVAWAAGQAGHVQRDRWNEARERGAALGAWIAEYVADVRSNGGAYKAAVRADPESAARSVVQGLSDEEIRQFTRELRAEKRAVAKGTS